MKRFRYVLISSLIFLIPIILLYCGGNPAEEGQAAFDRGDYMQAINLFTKAKNENPDQTQYDEMIALSWMNRGQQLYSRSKNVKAYAGNFEKGINFIPDETSPEFKKKYSELLYNFAEAYINAKPANEIQAEQYQTKAVDYLKTACVMDDQNEPAWNLLEKIKKENFQKMFDKGEDYYKQAKKSGQPNLWLLAEIYLSKAAEYDPDHNQAAQLLKATRNQTIAIPVTDPSYGDIGFAIADRNFLNNVYIIDLQVYNNLHQQSVQLDPQNFYIADANGNIYKHETEALGKFKDKELQTQELKPLKDVGGWLAFKMKNNTDVDFLAYELDDDTTIKKYFP